jgi:dTDP-4-amino-4,6-dideoxygalactose transaminase
MADLLLDVGPGDEVIVPTFTFVSSINAFVLRGARPVFADIRPDTLNIDERQIERLVTPRTRAIVPVHYAGVGCQMDVIQAVAGTHGLAIVEDNAHGLLGTFRGTPLGTFGTMSTQSFHETKNFTCGEGGALLINDPSLVDRAEIIREKGTNRSQFFRGQVDKYNWIDIGSSYIPSDLLGAMLLGQLERRDFIQTRRRAIWDRYHTELSAWASEQGVRRPTIPIDVEQSYHLYYLLLPSLNDRTRFIEHLRDRGILSVFHYVPLHTSPMGRTFGGREGDCTVAEDLADRLVRLPLFVELSDQDQSTVIDAVTEFACE